MPSSTLAEGARPRGSALDPSGSRRRRPLAWLALAFLAGIVLDEWQRPALSTLGGWCVGTALTAILLLVSGPRRGRLLLGAGLLAALAGGALRHAQTTRHLPAHDVTRRTGEAPGLAWLEGTILERERTGPDRARLRWTVELHALGASPDTLAPASGRVQLALNLDEAGAAAEPCEGERVRVLARLEAPHGGTLPGTYDAARRLARQGIRRVGEPAADTLVRVAHASWLRPGLRMRRIGGALAERNEGWLDADRAGLLNALVLGRRAGLAYEDREAFQRAGAAHLLAISGLHVHALALVLFFALGRLGIGRRGAMLGVMLAGAGYAFLAGAPASAVRAALMIGVFGVGLLARRAADPLTSLAVAALGILFIAPDELFTAGFQLSFLAVLALVTLYPTFESAWLRWRNVPEPWVKDPDEARKTAIARGLRRYVFISLATWIGTAPAVAWHLGGFNLLAVFANLVAVPLAGLAFVGGLLATLAGGGALSALLAVPLTILLGFNRFVGELPAASVEVPAPAGWACAAYAGLLGWAWLERGRRLTLPQAAWILPLCAAAILAGGLFRDRPERPRVTIYDLAFGRAALVETPGGEAALVDAGGEGDGRKLAEGLRRQGSARWRCWSARKTIPMRWAERGSCWRGCRSAARSCPAPRHPAPNCAGWKPSSPAAACPTARPIRARRSKAPATCAGTSPATPRTSSPRAEARRWPCASAFPERGSSSRWPARRPR
ncbi:MAG: ComEC family competence protein [Planctomycetota bacterium]|nr:ComEC family competence protein [Planctomycetota bacterium]